MKHKPIHEQVMVVFGASSGIGHATALAAADRGALVVAVGRDASALDSLAAACAERITTMLADAADPDEVADVASEAVTRYGHIDTWAHVAGIAEYARFEDIRPDEFHRVIDVDLLGPVWGARAALPHLRRSRGAYVVVSSEVAKRSFPLLSSYSAAKHGVDGFVEALRVELRNERAGVSVVQIMPEAVDTPFFEHARSRLGVRGSAPPPVTSPEKVADAILHAAERGGRDVSVGIGAKAQAVVQRLSPRVMDAVARLVSPLLRSREPKAAGDDALFEAPDGDDRRHRVVSDTQC